MAPPHPDASWDQALDLHRRGALDEAERTYRALLEAEPNDHRVLYNLGMLLLRTDRAEDAVALLGAAAQADPSRAQNWLSYVEALAAAGRYASAQQVIDVLRQRGVAGALLDRLDSTAALQLGIAFSGAGAPAEAAAQYRRILARDPANADALANLGATEMQLGRGAEAEQALQAALKSNPAHQGALQNYAQLLRAYGRWSEAAPLSQAFAATTSDLRAHLAAQLSLVPVPDSLTAIEAQRDAFAAGIEALRRGPDLELPQDPFPPPGFYLAYHGRDDRDLLERLGSALAAKATNLKAEFLPSGTRGQRERIRVVFLSDLFGDTTIGRLYQGVIGHLDRTRFEVIVAHGPRSRRDPVRDAIDSSAAAVVTLSGSLAEQRAQLRALDADVAFFTDVGMTSGTYLLAHSRYAPVQVVGWGHPDTTGLPTFDYYLSCDHFEPEGAEAHYSERLVRMPRNPAFCPPPEIEGERPSRSDLGLPESGVLYGCPQTLFKLHPDFDPALAQIAELDPSAWIVIPAAYELGWTEALKARWAAHHPHLAARVWFTPRIPRAAFLHQLGAFDVLLDPFHFGSGFTFYLAMAQGAPMVTWPGAFARGRVVSGLYAQMGIDAGLVASSPRDYAERAVSVAHAEQDALRRDLRAAAHRSLYSDVAAVRHLEVFLDAAVLQAREGTILPEGWTPPDPSTA